MDNEFNCLCVNLIEFRYINEVLIVLNKKNSFFMIEISWRLITKKNKFLIEF